MKNSNCICHMLYLRNSKAYYHDFCYTICYTTWFLLWFLLYFCYIFVMLSWFLCKVMISLGIVFIFTKFWFLGLLMGWKCKKWLKMTKNSVCRASYLRNHTSCDCHLWYVWIYVNLCIHVFMYLYKIMLSPGSFFIFSKFWFLGLLVG